MEDLIFKYLMNGCSNEEQESLQKWIEESDENLRLFSSMQLLYLSQTLPGSRADTKEELELFKAIREGSIRSRERKVFAPKYLLVASIAILLLLNLFINFIPFNRHYVDSYSAVASGQGDSYNHTLYTENGVKGYIVLPDSSKVWLNSGSKIIFPDKFSGKRRVVKICSGEFFFDVVSKPDTPFVVQTNFDMRVEVVGTAFNIRAYSVDNEIQTSLVSGALTLIKGTQIADKEEVAHLQPNDSYLVKGDNSSVLIKNSQVVSTQTAWRRGELIFEETPFEKVIQSLTRWHGTTFYIDDPEILNFKITASFKSASIIEIMEMVKFCSPIDYIINENSITLQKRK
ncbi:MAG: FecR domain-containing protein [Bacteroidales bacterium]